MTRVKVKCRLADQATKLLVLDENLDVGSVVELETGDGDVRLARVVEHHERYGGHLLEVLQ